jgi:hypothetical protein
MDRCQVRRKVVVGLGKRAQQLDQVAAGEATQSRTNRRQLGDGLAVAFDAKRLALIRDFVEHDAKIASSFGGGDGLGHGPLRLKSDSLILSSQGGSSDLPVKIARRIIGRIIAERIHAIEPDDLGERSIVTGTSGQTSPRAALDR